MQHFETGCNISKLLFGVLQPISVLGDETERTVFILAQLVRVVQILYVILVFWVCVLGTAIQGFFKVDGSKLFCL